MGGRRHAAERRSFITSAALRLGFEPTHSCSGAGLSQETLRLQPHGGSEAPPLSRRTPATIITEEEEWESIRYVCKQAGGNAEEDLLKFRSSS